METPTYPVISKETIRQSTHDDDASSVGDNASVSGSLKNVTREEAENELQKLLGRNEGRLFSSLRISFLFILALSTTAVAYLVYKFLSEDEKESFNRDFESNAQKIIEAFHESVAEKLIAIDALATSVTAYALNEGLTFPNVTIPDFDVSVRIASSWPISKRTSLISRTFL